MPTELAPLTDARSGCAAGGGRTLRRSPSPSGPMVAEVLEAFGLGPPVC